ncbi:hypothetical protein BJ085DRAFT_35247 [Dimargaris cristalligena]|uniref:CCHC-type domain-containing protein n=1 Tax=Dimargaris cristalligena TaxID=215637 RepID=A0A4P9ZQ03_9FUNG|nr:hypothetical protein BJ085DRAFT_35247 [Dimargaris cristalligena]|eukprot:RKP35335.1 hypothetical protein BJ085DRAFT_35247 [Dimargaris cristalligena]
MSATLFIGNLLEALSDTELEGIFKPFGEIVRYDIKPRIQLALSACAITNMLSPSLTTTTLTPKSYISALTFFPQRDFAFVEYKERSDAEEAQSQTDGQEVQGRRLKVEFARRGRPGGARTESTCFRCNRPGHFARDCGSGGSRDGRRSDYYDGRSDYSSRRGRSRSPRRDRGRDREPRRRSRSRSPDRRRRRERSVSRDHVRKEREPRRRSPSPRRRSPSPRRRSPSTRSPPRNERRRSRTRSRSPRRQESRKPEN